MTKITEENLSQSKYAEVYPECTFSEGVIAFID